MRVREGETRAAVGRQRRARVESEPAHPQQRGAGDREREVVREDGIRAVTLALAEHDHAGETGDAGVDVHHGAAREVEHAERGEPAVGRPHPVRHRHVDAQRPQRHEHEHRGELDALGERAGDQRRRDDREHELEHHEDGFGDGRREVADRHLAALGVEQAFEREARRAAEPRRVFGECQAVADDDPQHGDEAGDRETLRHRRQQVFLAHHAAIEERETRQRHQQHERGRRQHPGGVAAWRSCRRRRGTARCGAPAIGGLRRRPARRRPRAPANDAKVFAISWTAILANGKSLGLCTCDPRIRASNVRHV